MKRAVGLATVCPGRPRTRRNKQAWNRTFGKGRHPLTNKPFRSNTDGRCDISTAIGSKNLRTNVVQATRQRRLCMKTTPWAAAAVGTVTTATTVPRCPIGPSADEQMDEQYDPFADQEVLPDMPCHTEPVTIAPLSQAAKNRIAANRCKAFKKRAGLARLRERIAAKKKATIERKADIRQKEYWVWARQQDFYDPYDNAPVTPGRKQKRARLDDDEPHPDSSSSGCNNTINIVDSEPAISQQDDTLPGRTDAVDDNSVIPAVSVVPPPPVAAATTLSASQIESWEWEMQSPHPDGAFMQQQRKSQELAAAIVPCVAEDDGSSDREMLSASPTESEFDNSYRKLALRLHPDKNGGTEQAKKRFQHMKERYETLKKRRMQDAEPVPCSDSDIVVDPGVKHMSWCVSMRCTDGNCCHHAALDSRLPCAAGTRVGERARQQHNKDVAAASVRTRVIAEESPGSDLNPAQAKMARLLAKVRRTS